LISIRVEPGSANPCWFLPNQLRGDQNRYEAVSIKWPGVLAGGGTSRIPTIGSDLDPTLLDMAGLTPEPSLDGGSRVPALKAEADSGQPIYQRKAIYRHFILITRRLLSRIHPFAKAIGS
jgi:hypothetical protein